MSRIYIHEIPNAGDAAEAFLTRSSTQRINLGAAANLLTPTIEQGAFDGAAKGLGSLGQDLSHLGETGAKVAAIRKDFRERDAASRDLSGIATATRMQSEAFDKYKASLPSVHEDQYLTK